MSLARRRLAALALAASLALPALAAAETISVAVAANFTDAARDIAAAFTAQTHDDVRLSFGASGTFVTQITQGAPFQVFLSADAARPRDLVAAKLGVPGTTFTYAIGKLVLWSREPGVVAGPETLAAARFDKLSICNPAAAPYGEAAVQTLRSLHLYDQLQPKLVTGANITQAYEFVASGNAELGFVALSQIANTQAGSRWMVPQDLYAPIRQDAVLLAPGADSPAARAFLAYLRGPEATAIIAKYGYVTDQ